MGCLVVSTFINKGVKCQNSNVGGGGSNVFTEALTAAREVGSLFDDADCKSKSPYGGTVVSDHGLFVYANFDDRKDK